MIEQIRDRNVAVFDHVGIKAGMNYYDDGLMEALSRKGIGSYIFSNYCGLYEKDVTYYTYYQKTTNSTKTSRLLQFILSTIKSSKKAKIEKVDLVLIHIFSFEFVTLMFTLIPKLFNLSIGLIVHDVRSFKNNDNSWFRDIILNYLSKYIIVHNHYSYQELLKIQKIKNIEKVYIIKHGSFCQYLRDAKIAEKSDLNIFNDNTKKYILFFGQIKNEKGLGLLISSMDQIDEKIHLIIAGDGDITTINEFYKQNENPKDSNRTTAINRFINHYEKVSLFRNVDMIVLPYNRVYQSGVMLFAMSIGLPILASDLDPFKEIIQHKSNGLMFKSNDKKDLIIKINKYINNTKLLYEIAENAKQFVENEYSWLNIAEDYVRLIDLHQRKVLQL